MTANDEQLEWERRTGRLAAAAAFVSAAASVAAVALQLSIGDTPDDDRDGLVSISENAAAIWGALGAQTVSFVALALVLLFLLRVTVARRPDIPSFVGPLVILAPMLLVVGGILNQIDLSGVAGDFVDAGERSEKRADDLLDDRAILGPILYSGGVLCLAISFVFIGLNSMRAGLLSRFMGVLGILLGVLLVLPLLPGGQSVVQLFWLIAIGFLFLGRWPGGRGPAWDTGEPIEWPSAAKRQQVASGIPPEPDLEAEAEQPASKSQGNRRKRKKRR